MTGEPPWHERDDLWRLLEHTLFGDRLGEPAAKEAAAIVDLLKLAPAASVLDIPCGVGRHTLELARRGFRVTAVDRTRSYLDRARASAAAAGLSAEWVQSDMREFVRPGEFDAVVNYYTSFGYFEDIAEDRRVLANFRSCLKPGGRLLIDVLPKEVLAKTFRDRDGQMYPDGTLMVRTAAIRPGWDWIDNTWVLIKGAERFEWHIGHRLYSAAELRREVHDAGFEDVRVFGSVQGTPFDQTATRLVLTAQRPETDRPRPAG